MPFIQFFALADMQARMALKSDASRYYFGYLWWILEPLLYVAVFYVVFEVILGSRRTDFLMFLMCGKLPYIWFSKSVSQASNSIVANAGLIGRIDVRKTLFPLAIIQEGVYKQLAVFALLITVLLFNGYEATSAWLYLVPLAFVQYIMIVACSFIGAFLVCFMRDFTMLISLGMVFLMFTSGIFWDVRSLAPELTKAVLLYNPIAFLLDGYRQVLMESTAPALLHLFAIGLIFTAVIALMSQIMNRTSRLLALKALTA